VRAGRGAALAGAAAAALALPGPLAAGRLVLDLGTGTLNGRQVLGRPLDAAVAALLTSGIGPPTARIDLGAGIVALRFGPERGFRALVLLRPTGAGEIATALATEAADVSDPKAGPLLAEKPKLAVARALRAYGSAFRHERCVPACPLHLLSADGRLRVAFGSAAGWRYVRVELARAAS